ncbi:MAG: methyl-accepting chemotaxis protein [Pseudomonadota bacterium]
MRDAMEEFHLSISTIPAAGFEFVARLALIGECDERRAETELLQRIVAQFEEAKQLLGRGLEMNFQKLDKPVPEALHSSAASAQRCLTSMLTELGKAVKLSDGESALGATCRDILARQIKEVSPAIAQVMSDLDAAIASSEDEAGRDNKTLITSAVSEIDDINSVINLISVNASVEAARAGPAGRGFAVIASEIQSLSHRSQQAVSNIRSQLR